MRKTVSVTSAWFAEMSFGLDLDWSESAMDNTKRRAGGPGGLEGRFAK